MVLGSFKEDEESCVMLINAILFCRMFYIVHLQCEHGQLHTYLSFSSSGCTQSRRPFGFICHTSLDALSFDVNYMWQERARTVELFLEVYSLGGSVYS